MPATSSDNSRPAPVTSLEEGTIPDEPTPGGRHRRACLHDVVTDQERKRTQRREALASLTAEASDAGLYGQSAGDYRQALESARRDLSAENR